MSKFQLNAVQTAAAMAILTLVSKLFGFVREMVMANYYGTSYIADAYQMAVSVPSILLNAFFVAVATSYMPLFSKSIETEGEKAGNDLTSGIFNILIAFSICSVALGITFSDQLVRIFASGFEGETAALTSFYLKFSFAFILFTSLYGIVNSYLQYKNSFLPPIISGYFYSLASIVGIYICARTSYYYLMIGGLTGWAMAFFLGFYFVKRKGFRYKLQGVSKSTARQIFILAIPVFVGSAANSIGYFVDRTLASGLPEGSVAALGYGNLIVGLLSGLTTSILMTMIYPKLAQAASNQDSERLNDLLGTGISLVVIIGVPCTLGGLLYANQIIQVVYERGIFDQASTALTSTAFFYYVIGLSFFAINAIQTYTCYSLRDTKTPVIGGIIAVSIDIVLNIILVKSMAHGGLALATSIGAICNTVILYSMIRKKYPQVTIIRSRLKICRIILAACVAVGASWLAYDFIIMPISHILYPRILQLGLAVAVAGGVYYILLRIMRIEEIQLLRQLVRIKI